MENLKHLDSSGVQISHYNDKVREKTILNIEFVNRTFFMLIQMK